MRRTLVRVRAVAGLTAAELRYAPSRTALAAVAVAVAVLATTLLASVGYGVVATGHQQFDRADRDLWIAGGPLRLTTSGFENGIVDSHRLADEVMARDDVRTAAPIAFQAVFVANETSEPTLLAGVGVTNDHGGHALERGQGFARADVHYANGTYDGPTTRTAIVDPRTAARLDVDVGDRVYVGGSPSSVRAHAFEVVGVSSAFGRFLGSPTVTLHLSELQELTGTTASDRAALVAVALEPGADPDAVAAAVERRHPGYDVRTNAEQLRSMLRNRAVFLVSGAALVVLAVLSGLVLTANLLALYVSQRRRELAALKAIGLSRATLVGVVAGQGFALGALGGALGLLATPPAALALNRVAERLVGFEGLVQTPPAVFVLGGAVALGIGTVAAAAAGLRAARLPPLSTLRR